MKFEHVRRDNVDDGRSRKGAWIEIAIFLTNAITVQCRSRKGAWIEINSLHLTNLRRTVAPARERGLKYLRLAGKLNQHASLPQGSVD